MSVTVKNVSEELYSGFDGDELVTLKPGESVEVSDAKAAQLAEDRPHEFEIAAAAASARPEAPTMEHLLKLTRGEIDSAAASFGVDNPAALPNKQAVAEAILAAAREEG